MTLIMIMRGAHRGQHRFVLMLMTTRVYGNVLTLRSALTRTRIIMRRFIRERAEIRYIRTLARINLVALASRDLRTIYTPLIRVIRNILGGLLDDNAVQLVNGATLARCEARDTILMFTRPDEIILSEVRDKRFRSLSGIRYDTSTARRGLVLLIINDLISVKGEIMDVRILQLGVATVLLMLELVKVGERDEV